MVANLLHKADQHTQKCKIANCHCHKQRAVEYIMSKGFKYSQSKVKIHEDEVALIKKQSAIFKEHKASTGKSLSQLQETNKVGGE